MNNVLLYFIGLFCISFASATAQDSVRFNEANGMMMFADTINAGRPFAKDPYVISFKDGYLMYYTVPTFSEAKSKLIGGIGIAKSTDLIHWERIGSLAPECDAAYEANGYCAASALVIENVVHLFYQTYGNREKDAICHAWSTDGIKFTRDPSNPVFHPDGDWNCGRAIDAEVIKFKGKYYLYFATRDPDFKTQMLGVAVAPGNTDFRRSDWEHMSTSGPILKPELDWETNCIEAPSVIVRGDSLFMFYAGGYNNDPQQIGVAKSTDGLYWERTSDTPFLANGIPGSWNSSESGHPDIFTDVSGKTILFYQGNNNHGQTWHISNIEVFWDNRFPDLKREQ
ncbi:MAG: family 43 glycosylhydrolase [Mangrovibacterium sp.]